MDSHIEVRPVRYAGGPIQLEDPHQKKEQRKSIREEGCSREAVAQLSKVKQLHLERLPPVFI